jgi:hypothetical protein
MESPKASTGKTSPDSYVQIVQWARDGKLIVAVERTARSEIETAWQRTDIKGDSASSRRTITSRLARVAATAYPPAQSGPGRV